MKREPNQYEKLNPMHGVTAGKFVWFTLWALLAGGLFFFLAIWTIASVMAGSVPAAGLAGFGWFFWWLFFFEKWNP